MKTLNVKKMAELFDVSRVTIWRWRREKIIPEPIRLSPRVVVWLEEDIAALLTSKKEKEMCNESLGTPQQQAG